MADFIPGRRRLEIQQSQSQCSDLCEHCMYIESGDFVCDVTHDATIVDWKPFSCVCPKKRRLNK